MSGENQLYGWTGQILAPIGLRDDGRQSEEQSELPRFNHKTCRGQNAEALSNAAHEGSTAIESPRQRPRRHRSDYGASQVANGVLIAIGRMILPTLIVDLPPRSPFKSDLEKKLMAVFAQTG
jgi:hypothetical protein